MAKRVIILRAAGINCDEETAHAWELAGATAERVHVQRVIESPSLLDGYDALTIPGGFSYGDDVAAGKILANQIMHHLADALRAFVERGRPVLGICNGFQVLVRTGLLPGIEGEGVRNPSPHSGPGGALHEGFLTPSLRAAPSARQTVTLANNDSGRFEDRWVYLQTGTDRCVFLPSGTRLALPIAHGEGKLVPMDDATLTAMRDGGYIALRYCDEAGKPGPFPINPNGSVDDIAGLTDKTGLILGLMPHPERNVHPAHPPTRAPASPTATSGIADGRVVFESAVRYLRG